MPFADINVESKYPKPTAMDVLWSGNVPRNKLKPIHGVRRRWISNATAFAWLPAYDPLGHALVRNNVRYAVTTPSYAWNIFYVLFLFLKCVTHCHEIVRRISWCFPVLSHEPDARVSDDGSPSALTNTMIPTCLTRNVLFHFCTCGSARAPTARMSPLREQMQNFSHR